jgi:hypothetical protein
MPLLTHFLEKHGARLGRSGVALSGDAMDRLRRYAWPGNVRELENVIERALVLGVGPAIEAGDLPDTFKMAPPRRPESRIGGRWQTSSASTSSEPCAPSTAASPPPRVFWVSTGRRCIASWGERRERVRRAGEASRPKWGASPQAAGKPSVSGVLSGDPRRELRHPGTAAGAGQECSRSCDVAACALRLDRWPERMRPSAFHRIPHPSPKEDRCGSSTRERTDPTGRASQLASSGNELERHPASRLLSDPGLG